MIQHINLPTILIPETEDSIKQEELIIFCNFIFLKVTWYQNQTEIGFGKKGE